MEINLNTNNSVMKLEGANNWNIWKFQTTVILRGQGWLDVVEGRALKPEVPAERTAWENKDAKAQTLLVTRMTEKVMLHIITCSTSADMWKKLQSVYEQKTETNIHIIQQRFFQFKFETGTEMSTFLSKIQELQNQLKQMGEEVSDKFVITKVLMSLPDEYRHFISAWESAPDDKQTVDNLVARLLIEEERVKEKNGQPSPSGSSAFVVKDKKNIKCFKCNKMGHFQSECYSNNNSCKSEGQNNKCYYCGKSGHNKSKCWFKKNKEKDHKENNAFVVSSSLEEYHQSQWLVDTGASEHMCRDRELFKSFTDAQQESVIVGNGSAISVLGYGQMAVEVYDGSEWVQTLIDKVLFVPELKTNLFSVNCASDKGYVMLTDNNSCKFYKNKQVCAIAKRVGSSYYLELRYKNIVANVANKVKSTLQDWHERLAHQNFDYVKKILLKNNIDVKQTSVTKCESCLEGKIHRLPFGNSETVTTKTCELIHADTCGPMEVMSVGGSRYFVILKDDFSSYRSVYFVKNKSEIKNSIEDFINKAENVTGNRIKMFRTDNGLEFINREVKEILTKRGIIHQTSVPYTPQQNGKAERENRTLVEAARTMLNACKDLPKSLWAEAINTAAFVLNRTGKSKDGEKSPYEVWFAKQFDIHQLKPFGTPVYVHIPKEKRKKWDSKGEKGVMVGYGETVKGYRIYFSHKNGVELKRDIVFLEKEQNYSEVDIKLNYTEENDKKISETESTAADFNETMVTASMSEESGSEYDPNEETNSSAESIDEVRQREPSKRVRKRPVYYHCQNVYTEQCEPVTYGEAMMRSDSSKWKEAIDRELKTLEENNTWEVCEVPENEKVVSSKWVFKVKRGDQNFPQYKARLVARGFEQDDILDLNDCYAPVAKLSSVRLFVIIATKLNLPLIQMDVTGAFLYGKINETVYVRLPEGAYSGNSSIVKLKKSLYGLKSSPKCWNITFNDVMLKEGFIRSKSDSCLYTKCTDSDQIYLLLYVDDVLIFGTNDDLIKQVKMILNQEFKMKDLGFVTDYLGITITQNLDTGVTELSQRKYLENVLKRFGMEQCKPMSTPIDQNINLKLFQNHSSTIDKNIEKLCRQIIGCLMYAVSGTRPDLCFIVSLLSRYQKCANDMLLSALKRVLRYVKHTLDYKLVYKCTDNVLEGYCDADWGGDLSDRKSTTGYLFKFSNCLISWSSKKQVSVSLSSTESEYVAISMAASEACWLVNLLNDFKINNVCPVHIYSDNQSAISVACTDTVKRLKHIDIRYHFVKELIKNKRVCLEYVKTSDQPADMLTKPLNKELIIRFLGKCGIGNIEKM